MNIVLFFLLIYFYFTGIMTIFGSHMTENSKTQKHNEILGFRFTRHPLSYCLQEFDKISRSMVECIFHIAHIFGVTLMIEFPFCNKDSYIIQWKFLARNPNASTLPLFEGYGWGRTLNRSQSLFRKYHFQPSLLRIG